MNLLSSRTNRGAMPVYVESDPGLGGPEFIRDKSTRSIMPPSIDMEGLFSTAEPNFAARRAGAFVAGLVLAGAGTIGRRKPRLLRSGQYQRCAQWPNLSRVECHCIKSAKNNFVDFSFSFFSCFMYGNKKKNCFFFCFTCVSRCLMTACQYSMYA